MFFQRKQKCPKCGAENSPDASYCMQCATPLKGGEKRCGACGAINPGDAVFCHNCGQSLSQSAAPLISQNRWVTGDNDFAVRVDVDDLEQHLKKGLNVEAGTNAMLLENGANRGLVPPGSYVMDSFMQRFGDVFRSGLPKQMTILLARVTPTDLDYVLEGIFSKDPLRIGVSVKLQVEVGDPGKFLVNVLRGRERFTAYDLQQYLYPEVASVVDDWVRMHTVQELAEDLSLKAKLELAIDESLRRTFAHSGLRFLQVRAVSLNLEVIDRVNGIKSDYALQVTEAEANVEGRTRLVDVQHKMDLVGIAEETGKLEIQERKIALYARMRDAVNSDRMDEVLSEKDFEYFLRDIDRKELLDKKEHDELLRLWKEEAEDHDRARQHLLAQLDISQRFELKIAELKEQHAYDTTMLQMEQTLDDAKLDHALADETKISDHQIAEARKWFDEQMALTRKGFEIESEKLRLDIETTRLVNEQDRADMAAYSELALRILKNTNELERLDEEERRRIAREDELIRVRTNLDITLEAEKQRHELAEQTRAAERQYELDKLAQLGTFSTEQLVAVSSAEQGHILAELKRTDALKGMTEDQILAMAAENSPAVALAFQERFRAVAEGKVSQREVQLYERLLGDQKDVLAKMEHLSDQRVKDVTEANQRAQEAAMHAMDKMTETAKAFAEKPDQPVVIVPGQTGGTQVINPAAGQTAGQSALANKMCVSCGRQIDVQAKHCPYCGHKFEGV